MFHCVKEPNRYKYESEFLQDNYMFPHEFLYIVPNSKPRSDLIEDLCSVKKPVVKHKIHNYEFLNKKTLNTEELIDKQTELH